MSHQKNLRELMLKRIKALRTESQKLSRRAGASMDSRSRAHLRQLAHESKRKADMLEARYNKLFAEHLESAFGVVANG